MTPKRVIPIDVPCRKLARSERDCMDLSASLTQAWRAMREAERLLTSPDPNPIGQVVTEHLLAHAIANARAVLDRTSQPSIEVVPDGRMWDGSPANPYPYGTDRYEEYQVQHGEP